MQRNEDIESEESKKRKIEEAKRLIFFVKYIQEEKVHELLDKEKPDVNYWSKTQYDSYTTALLEAIDSGRPKVVHALLKHGADVNNQPSSPMLHAVTGVRNLDIIHMLLIHGADIDQKNSLGETIMDLAKDKRCDERASYWDQSYTEEKGKEKHKEMARMITKHVARSFFNNPHSFLSKKPSQGPILLPPLVDIVESYRGDDIEEQTPRPGKK